MTILSKETAEKHKQQNYTQRQSKFGRPVSPHVTIYSFPMGALSSISNRLSGIMLSFGAAGVGTVELVGGTGSALQLMQAVGSASNPVLLVAGAKFSVAFPLIYHYLGAVRQ